MREVIFGCRPLGATFTLLVLVLVVLPSFTRKLLLLALGPFWPPSLLAPRPFWPLAFLALWLIAGKVGLNSKLSLVFNRKLCGSSCYSVLVRVPLHALKC